MEIVNRSKICSSCGVEKPHSEFYKQKDKKDGLRSNCKTCISEKSKQRWSSDSNFRKRGNMRSRKHALMKNYGLTMDDFFNLVEEQGGKCAICQIDLPHTKPVVDHCHVTGKVRGILCHKCNSGIGMLNDDARTIERALKYISQ